MKASIAITLIILGTVLIILPPAANYLHQHSTAGLLDSFSKVPGASGPFNVTLPSIMTPTYSFGCWLVGAAMIVTAIRCSLPGRTRSSVSETVA
jgi:hypothetical protein